MIKLISLVVLLVSNAICAPTPDMGQQQFLILTPQTQVQLDDSLKLQQPLLQPLIQLGRIEAPQQQMLLYYPDAAGGQFQLKQNNVWQQFLNYFGFGGQPAAESTDARTTTKAPTASSTDAPIADAAAPSEPSEPSGDSLAKQVMFEKDAETFEVNNPMPQMPAVPSVPQFPGLQPDHRFFILSGQPQFFGNFNPLLNPINPINSINPVFSLQPLQTIKTRSTDNQIQAESDVKIAPSSEVEQHLVQPFAPVVPLEPGVPLQLRSKFESPVSELRLEEGEQILALATPQILNDAPIQNTMPMDQNVMAPAMEEMMKGEMKKDEPISNEEMMQKDLLNKEMMEKDMLNKEMMAMEMMNKESMDKEMMNKEMVAMEMMNKESMEKEMMQKEMMEKEAMKQARKEEQKPVEADSLADPSLAAGPAVAQAGPTGIAVAGPGGIAQSAPLSTAYAGDGGIAVASPYAAAVAGDFLDGQLDEALIKATDNDKKIL